MDRQEPVLDVRGLKCPLPALFVRRRLMAMPDGAELIVLTDDPMAPLDIPHMCRTEGFVVLATERNGDQARLTLRRP